MCITKDVACKANNMLSVVDAVVRVAFVNCVAYDMMYIADTVCM